MIVLVVCFRLAFCGYFVNALVVLWCVVIGWMILGLVIGC